MEDNSHKTAITRSKLSLPMEIFKPYITGDALDFGCGKGSDADALEIDKYDPHFFPTRPLKKYDTITLIYVLNTVHVPLRVLKDALMFLKPGGMIMIACRTPKEIDKLGVTNKWKKYNEGYATNKGTFQRGISCEELIRDLNHLVHVDIVEQGDSKFSFVVAKRV